MADPAAHFLTLQSEQARERLIGQGLIPGSRSGAYFVTMVIVDSCVVPSCHWIFVTHFKFYADRQNRCGINLTENC